MPAVSGLRVVRPRRLISRVFIVALLLKEERTSPIGHVRREIHLRARAGTAHARSSDVAIRRAHAIEARRQHVAPRSRFLPEQAPKACSWQCGLLPGIRAYKSQ